MNGLKRVDVVAVIHVLILITGRIPALAAPAEGDNGDSRPNILFIFTDDHARQAISAYGSQINETPNLDRLASQGMLFRNCFCTNSICAPSRAVILTGKHSHINGVIDNAVTFDGSQQTFPKLLRSAGYQTAMIGKWHLKSNPTGFDYWEVLPGQGRYYNPDFLRPNGGTVEQVRHTGYVTDVITDLSIKWLEDEWDRSKPFLLMSQHKAPHRHWLPGPDHLTLYDDRLIPEPPTLFDDYKGRTSAARGQTMTIARHLNEKDLKLVIPHADRMTEQQLARWKSAYEPKNRIIREADLKGQTKMRWQYQRYIKDYLRCIASVDDNVGRLLDYLDENGLADNTVVVYSSDQGFYLGEHGWIDKRWMYEESLAMPLIVRWPGMVAGGSESRHLVQNLDFAETFLEIAGGPVPASMQGRSLLPLLRGQAPQDWRRSIYYHYYEFPSWHDVRRHEGVRTKRYKLIHYYNIGEWELFDLQRDPHELRSSYPNPLYADTVQRLKAELNRLRDLYRVDSFQESPPPPDPKKVTQELVLHFDASRVEGDIIMDISNHDHEATRANVTLVEDGNGKAFRFNGDGVIRLEPFPDSLDPTYRPFTVGAWCRPATGDGVIVAHGDRSFGYALYLEKGCPCFDVQAGQLRYLVRSPNQVTLDRWIHLAGIVDADARMSLRVDGTPVAQLDRGFFVNNRPGDGFSVGADIGSAVGPYAPPMRFSGLIKDVRLYWNVPDEATLRAWARP